MNPRNTADKDEIGINGAAGESDVTGSSTDNGTDIAQELLDLFGETRALFHCLRAVAAAVHKGGELSAGLRGVLYGLAERGPRTVPQIARSRPTSRQHIQMLANRLKKEGLVEFASNPDHKRSKLVQLTRRGRDAVNVMQRREVEVLSELRFDLSPEQIRAAGATLRSGRKTLLAAYANERLENEAEEEGGDE